MKRALPALLVLASCAHGPLPEDRSERALYRDLQRLVSLTDSSGWDIDRLELDSLLPAALLSVCRVERDHHAALLDWLSIRIADLGGPVATAYADRGRELDEVAELLETTRIAMLLRHAVNQRDDDCPFWIEVEPEFRGEQIADDRWQLSLGTGGKGILVHQGGRADINFGGAGRLLFGRAIGETWAVYVGAEGGAVASFPRDEDGGRSNLVLGLDFVVPAVVRYRFVNAYLEVEAGYLAHVTERRFRPVHGFHVGLAGGARASRQILVFPGAGFGISYERTVPGAGEESRQTIKLGFRVEIDVNL